MAEEGLAVIERRFGVDRRKSAAIAQVIVLLLAAILATRLLAGVPAASLPLRDLAVLVDPVGTETIASVSAALGRFKPVKGDFSAGFTRDVHWLRFTVQAPSAGPRWLEVRPALLDDLRLFEPSVGGFIEHHTGDRQPIAKRELNNRNFLFKLDLPDTAPRSFYLRIETTSSAQARLKLWQPDDFAASDSLNMAGLGFYFGLDALLFALNFVLWIKFRTPLLAWFSLHVLTHATALFGACGLASQFIVPGNPLVGDGWTLAGMTLYLSLVVPVYQRMLEVDTAASWMRVPFRIQLALPWLLLPAYVSGHQAPVSSLVVGVSTLFGCWALLLSLRLWHLGRVEAVWIFLSIALSFGGPGLYAMGLLGWLSPSQLSHELRLYASLGSLLALQVALAVRFNAVREHHARARLRAEQAERAAVVELQAQADLPRLYDEKVALLTEVEHQRALLVTTLEDLQHAQRLGKMGSWEMDPVSRDFSHSEFLYDVFGIDRWRQIRRSEGREKLFMPESRQRLQEAIARVSSGGGSFAIELEAMPGVADVRWVEIHCEAVFDDLGQLVKLRGTVQDITERHLLQQVTAAGLAESIANRNRSEFLARVSHELRTPLNAVLGFSQLLALEPAVRGSPLVAEQVGLIHGAADHLKSMIDDVLDLARIQSGGLRLVTTDCSVGPLAAECLSWLAAKAVARQVSLHLNVQDRVWLAVADPSRLRQILINLLSNAIKYNCMGGSVWLSLSHEPASDGSAAGCICTTVSDTGPGLTQGQIDAMYQPFNRLGAELGEIQGTGLGLSVARDLAEAMGGSLQVQSETGKGSVFTLRLVAADLPWLVLGGGADLDAAGITGVASDVNPADAFQVELSRGPPRPFVVLYVEDNRLNVMVMRHAIKRLPGVHLEVAIDGGTGLALAQRLRPNLLLLDMNMPVLSGTEVMLRVRADPALATLTCVAVSANSLPEDIERAMSAGFDDYITKPFAVARVLDLVDRLRRGAGPNPEHERGIGVA